MDAKATVLVVDDDPAILELMRDFLENDGYHVQTAPSGPDALRALASAPVDCLLLDIMMPGQSGFDLCRRIRDTCDVPILFLSARDADADKIRGLGLGGDDYIVKSATPSEVVARVKAVLRRTQRQPAPPLDILDYGRLVLDVRAHEVRIAGQPVAFAVREFELLQLLAEHPRQLFTYDQLFERFWGEYGDRHTVAVHVGRIRQKIEVDPAEPRYIVTVWGVGYRFDGARQ
jgi:DNA-binding response OmpR family regulator